MNLAVRSGSQMHRPASMDETSFGLRTKIGAASRGEHDSVENERGCFNRPSSSARCHPAIATAGRQHSCSSGTDLNKANKP